MPQTSTHDARPADRRVFLSLRHGLWSHLPFGLSHVVPVTLVGFALINGCTFLVDLGLLTLLYGRLELPHAGAVVIAYSVAFGLAFVVNRRLNFDAHGDVGGQVGRYVLVTLLNFAVLVVGGNVALHALGVQYQLGRTLVAVAELAWMYSTMRWFVFASRRPRSGTPGRRH